MIAASPSSTTTGTLISLHPKILPVNVHGRLPFPSSPWVGNCVGAKNHKYFIGYLVFLLAGIAVTFYGCYYYWRDACTHSPGNSGSFGALRELATCDAWVSFVLFESVVHVFWVAPLTACQLYQVRTMMVDSW